ncbi:predicted protein [Naegleria gruberi]|uniref:Predicted protein n=1 Tax=Naegleria gruberi TaxID=5762 RepID=D2UY51_NAEGR|nr:uncharacterized protein NAEGRDRAFT_77760 [Naegleria gruberi]EFC50414.1 predicted protein [Naegleria gruberi]|eukprot:XP_002683158.1 predicted protein [Naegleria gruberi strain NEG-M]
MSNNPQNPFQRGAPVNAPGTFIPSPRLSPQNNNSRNVTLPPQPVSYSSSIMTLIPLDAPDEWDKLLSQCWTTLCEEIQLQQIRKDENLILTKLQEKNFPPNNKVPMYGLLYGILTAEDATQSGIFFRILNAIVHDHKTLSDELKKFIESKFYKLQDPITERIATFLNDCIKINPQFDAPFISLVKNMKTYEFTKRNLTLADKILDICYQNKEWIYANAKVLMKVLYSFLRMIEDMKIFGVDRQYEALMRKQLQLVEDIIRDNLQKEAIQSMGRDFVRVVYSLAKKYKVSDSMEKLLGNQDFLKIMNYPSSSRVLDCRISHDMYTQISFLISNVKFGNQKRYQSWFAQRFFATPESEAVIPDLVRYINCVYHPPHESMPRWAVLGWLLKSVKNEKILENTKLAIVYDLLFTISSDMNEEFVKNIVSPTFLILSNNVGKYPEITNSLLDFIFYFIERTDQYLHLTKQQIIGSLQTCTQKFGASHIATVIEKTDNERRERVKKYFTIQSTPQVQPPVTVTPLQIPEGAQSNSNNKSPTLSPSKIPPSAKQPSQQTNPPSSVDPTKNNPPLAVKTNNRSGTTPLAPVSVKSPTSPSRQPFASISKETDNKTIRELIEETTKTATNKTKFLESFEPLISNLTKQVGDYYDSISSTKQEDKEVEELRKTCNQTIKEVVEFFSNNVLNQQPTDIQAFATFIMRLVSFEMLAQTQSNTYNLQQGNPSAVIVQTILKERAEDEKKHFEKCLLRNQSTLLCCLLDEICTRVLSYLGNQNKEASSAEKNRIAKLKEKFSHLVKFMYKTDMSLGYRLLCFYVSKIYNDKIQALDLLKPTSTDPFINILIFSNHYKYKSGYSVFYDWTLGARKSSTEGAQTQDQVFIKDLSTCLEDNHLLFINLLPIISRDFSHYIQKNKEEFFKLIITKLHPYELQHVNTFVQNGKLKILFSQGKAKKASGSAQTNLNGLDYISQAIVMIQNLNDHFSDDYEHQMFWTLLSNEICYNHTLFCINQTEEESEKKTSQQQQQVGLYYKFPISQFIISLLNTLSQHEVYSDILLTLVQRLTAINPDGEALFSYEFIQYVMTLPFEKYTTFPSTLLHHYLQCQYIKNDGFLLEVTEKHIIGVLQEYLEKMNDKNAETCQDILMHLYYMKLLTNHSLHYMSSNTNNHYLLFECENFLKQIRKIKGQLSSKNEKMKFIFTQLIGDFDQGENEEDINEATTDDADVKMTEKTEEEKEEEESPKPPRSARNKRNKKVEVSEDEEEVEEDEEQNSQEEDDEETKPKKRKVTKEQNEEEQENDETIEEEISEDEETKVLNNIKSKRRGFVRRKKVK